MYQQLLELAFDDTLIDTGVVPHCLLALIGEDEAPLLPGRPGVAFSSFSSVINQNVIAQMTSADYYCNIADYRITEGSCSD